MAANVRIAIESEVTMQDWQPFGEDATELVDLLLITPDIMMDYLTSGWRKEQESKPININTKLSAALNKCPAHWVNGICINLGLDPKSLRKRKAKVQAVVGHLTDPQKLRAVLESLPPESREALDYVLGKGGVKLSRRRQRWAGFACGGCFSWARRASAGGTTQWP